MPLPQAQSESKLPSLVRGEHARLEPSAPTAFAVAGEPPAPNALRQLTEERRNAEAQVIVAALNRSLWNRKQAASLLEVDYKALLYKMKKLGIGEK